jgi:thiol-disulfide isomerase/thioredoxin
MRPLCHAVLALSLALTACKKSAPELEPPAGDIASSLSLPTADGETFDPAAIRGKPVILMFWRPNCPYCMNEMPIVAKVARDKDAAAVAVMVSGSKERGKAIGEEHGVTVLIDDGQLRERYGVTKVPYTLVLRGDGTAARAFLGEQKESTLASAVASAR